MWPLVMRIAVILAWLFYVAMAILVFSATTGRHLGFVDTSILAIVLSLVFLWGVIAIRILRRHERGTT